MNSECPKPGACLELEARVGILEDSERRHTASLERLGTACEGLGKDLHALRIESGLRNAQADSLKGWFLSMILVGLAQFAGTIWWASQLNTSVGQIASVVQDHEARIRTEERKP